MSAALLLMLCAVPADVRVGSKAFTEGVILGELATQVLEATGETVEHRRQLGGTRLVHGALKSGEIDVYAEYTGTLREEIYAGVAVDNDALARALAADGLAATRPLGFNNTYGLAMREAEAARLGIRRISDLARHPALTAGVSNEFFDRKDGWPALVARYALPLRDVRGMDHDVAYKALASGQIALTDCYTTDAEIVHHGLRVLDDDLLHFPRYEALFLYRTAAAPRVARALAALEGNITEAEMAALNARVRIERLTESAVARAFLADKLAIAAAPPAAERRADRLLRRTREHVLLVAAALAASVLLGLPFGIVAARRRRVGQVVLAIVGVLQTVPSLALLVLFVPVAGIGSVPAVMAMVLYGLLPIVRNVHSGLTGIAPPLLESAQALGLSRRAQLFLVELPLASPSILAGIQTSATIGVGTATIGALVGAGGYGQSILTGIRLDDVSLILEGALPAAAMAIALQLAFLGLERAVVPRGLRDAASRALPGAHRA